MYSTEAITQAANDIRPYLPSLLEAPVANRLARQVTALLNQSTADPATSQQLADLLSEQEVTRQWLHLYLDEHYSPEAILPLVMTYSPLSGSHNQIESPRYTCPVASCHQTWYRRQPDAAIPHCPIHDLPMVRDSKVH